MATPTTMLRVNAYVPADAGPLLEEVIRRRLAQTGYAPPAAEVWREAIMRGLVLMRDDLPPAVVAEPIAR